jgi:hypothetical protein
MVDADSLPAHLEGPTDEQRLTLTPTGALFAFSPSEPDGTPARLQTVLSGLALPTVSSWIDQGHEYSDLFTLGMEKGWLQLVNRNMPAPDVKLDPFLSHVIASLSGDRKAALASVGGFCVGRTGYCQEDAEALCVAAADFSDFARRQRTRGWYGASYTASFHEDIAMLMPTTSFIPFWVDGTDYCLVLGGEPLINNPAFVELLWGIKHAGTRFAAR